MCIISVLQLLTLCVFLIEDPVRMYGVAPGGKVLQVDRNDIPNLRPNDRPQEAQPGGAWDLLAVRPVRVLTEHGLLVEPADALGSFFKENGCVPEIRVEQRTLHKDIL